VGGTKIIKMVETFEDPRLSEPIIPNKYHTTEIIDDQ
jgi:hypothetical protein